MSTVSFSADVQAVAAAAGSVSQQIAGAAFNAAEFNGFNLGSTIKYNLNRLRGLQLITAGEQEQLAQLSDDLESKNSVSSRFESIQRTSNASPVAIALASIAAGMPASDLAAAQEALAAAVVGALVMFVTNPLASKQDNTGDGKAMACVLAAIGAAAVSATDTLARKRVTM
jgi:hypothetical protein